MDAKSMYGDPPKKKPKPTTTTVDSDVEFTKKHSDVRKKVVARIDDARANAQAFVTNKGAGTTTDTATNKTTPDTFKRTEKRGGSHTTFYGTDGKETFRGQNDSREVEEYRKKNARDETDVNKRRARNANDTDLFTDAKKDLTSSDKEMLSSLKHTSTVQKSKPKK